MLQKIKSLFRLACESSGRTGTPSGVQRLAIPHTFNQGLSVPEAVIATMQAFLRIFLSCLLFALWGTLALWLWNAMGPHYWRWLVPVPLLALFLSSFLALMVAISAAARAVTPKRL